MLWWRGAEVAKITKTKKCTILYLLKFLCPEYSLITTICFVSACLNREALTNVSQSLFNFGIQMIHSNYIDLQNHDYFQWDEQLICRAILLTAATWCRSNGLLYFCKEVLPTVMYTLLQNYSIIMYRHHIIWSVGGVYDISCWQSTSSVQ